MKTLSAIAVLAFAVTTFLAVPALARDHYVHDGAGFFSPATVQKLDSEISAFNAQTGKEIVVETVPSLNGKTAPQAAEDVFAQQQVNGVLIYMAKAERQDGMIGDRATSRFFPPGTFQSIRSAMRGYFRSGDFDTGIQTGVSLVLDQYRSHQRALGAPVRHAPIAATDSQQTFGGLGLFWIILIALAGFLIVRALFRAISAPRMMPPGYGGPGYGGPGFGGPNPGFGGGYGAPGYGGGGGGFMSGLLGGLGGAWLGNQLFGNHNPNLTDNTQNAGLGGGQDANDNSGWQSDAGQADMGNSSFGSFGDSGGGGFDSGGGGGFDSGSGGGDSGGGW